MFMRVLGIDPGTARIGWAVIEKQEQKVILGSHGCITTPQGQSYETRLDTVYQEISRLIDLHAPESIAVEQLYFSTNAKTAITVAQARGVILLACVHQHIPVVSYGPLTVKQTVTGDGKADKKQVERMVVRTLKLATAPKPDDVTDAVAIALTHAYTHHFH